jgi:methyl-accepting chemotaxis protein
MDSKTIVYSIHHHDGGHLIMKWFKNLKIGTKILAGFLIIAAIAGFNGIFGILLLKDMDQNTNAMFKNYGSSQGYLGHIDGGFGDENTAIAQLQLAKGADSVQTAIGTFKESDTEISTNMGLLVDTSTTPDKKALADDLQNKLNAFFVLRDQAVALAAAGNADGLSELMSQDSSTKIIEDVNNAIDAAVQQDEDAAAKMSAQQTNNLNITIIELLCAVSVAVVIAIVLGIMISRGISKPVAKLANAADKLAAGDTDIELVINSKDEIGRLAKSFGGVLLAIRKLIGDTNMLADAAAQGELSIRADVEQHLGDFKKVVAGFNTTLDTIIEPLNAVREDMKSLAKGERREVLDAELYNGDFKDFVNDMTTMRLTFRALVAESLDLASSALKGDLKKRADADKLQGLFRKILEGFNETLDAVINPVNEAAQVLGEVAKGNLSVRVEGDYSGDHALIKDALNETIDSMRGYIQEISKVLSTMANGNLDVEITSDFKGDFVELKSSINHIIDSLNAVLTEIRLTADQVSAGSDQVSAGNQAVSQGATEQASSIEELTVTIGNISAQTSLNVDTAKESKASAARSKQTAGEADMQMKDMLKSMEEINESSESISKIIKVIDDIAFQTNILALNAAVEAARAGTHGKGFAVVAEEVRNLAGRSANAAKETAELIEGSVKKVGEGAQLADRTAAALKLIVKGAQEAEILEEKILLASEEQAAGIRQVSQGIGQMSQVVQTNSASAQEGAAASQELSGQAELLKEKIEMFTLRK